MAASLEQILAQIQRWTSPPLQELSDALLLERFVQRRDESAFAALVTRHGRMVFRTCQGVLGDVHSAEDALQATFLILARKAHTLRRPAELPGWLHGVARRVALKARKKSVVRAAEMPLPDELPDTSNDPLTRLTARELLTVLDEEVSRLPKQQRLAVISCCMEGRAKAEAARMYGWTFGSLKGHLERGRRRLQKRLARRGITLSAALALVALSPSEAVSALLVQNAVRAGLHGCIRPTASTWAHSVLRAMILSKLAGVLAVTLTVALVVTTTAALVYRRPAVEVAQDKTPAAPAAPKDAKGDKPPTRTDALGDPLPAGALARLGTVRLRHGGLIRLAAFTADGKRLLSQGSDGVRLWDAATGKQLRYFAPESGNEWGATDLAPDGKTLAAAIESSDGHIDFWDISSGKKTISFGQGYYSIVRFSPNGKLLAAFSTAKAWLAVVEIWDVANQRKLLAWKAHGGHQVLSILFSSDSRRVITSALDGKVRIWDAATGRQLRELTRLDSKPGGRVPSAYGPSEALSPDGKLLALVELNEKSKSQMGAVQWKARISLRDPASGKQRRLLTCPSQEVYPGQAPEFSALAFTAGGKKLVTGGPDNYLRVWDSATGEEMRRWPLEFGRPYALIPSRDGKTLAAVMNQGQAIQLLDMAGGKPRQSAAGHLAHVYLAALTPDGRTAITVGGDRKLLLWDVASSRIRRILKGHEDGFLSALQLAQDGKTLYTAGWDKTLRIWDLISGEERRRFPMGPEFMPAWYGALALSPGGGVLAVLSEQKKIRLLDTTTCKELHRIEGPDW